MTGKLGLLHKIADRVDALNVAKRYGGFRRWIVGLCPESDPAIILPARECCHRAYLYDQLPLAVVAHSQLAGRRLALQQSGINSLLIPNNPHLYFHAPHASYRFSTCVPFQKRSSSTEASNTLKTRLRIHTLGSSKVGQALMKAKLN